MTAQVVEHSYYGIGRKPFWQVECQECLVVLNSGHHYPLSALHHADRLAEEHNALHHDQASTMADRRVATF